MFLRVFELLKPSYESLLRIQCCVKFLPSCLGLAAHPTFLVIGAQKSGTTALFNYFMRHPQVVRSKPKEVNFFQRDDRFRRGRNFYLTHFPLKLTLGKKKITFEATPSYIYSPQAAKRIKEYYPDIKLVAVLREPISRAFSHWNMFRQLMASDSFLATKRVPGVMSMFDGKGVRPFADLVTEEIENLQPVEENPEPSLVRRGIYHEQLARYFDLFDRSQILIIESSRLASQTQSELSRVSQHVGIDDVAIPNADSRYHKREYSDAIAPDVKERLRSFYRPHNEALFQLLGERFDWNDSVPQGTVDST